MSQAVASDTPDFGKLIVEFYMDAEMDERASWGWVEERYLPDVGEYKKFQHPGAGREIYRDSEYVEIRIPGNVTEVRRRRVRPSDLKKWPQEYAAFKQGLQSQAVGTPLDKLVPHILTKAQVLEFRAAGLRTAENIRDIPDSDAQKFMGMTNLKQKISDWLNAAAGSAQTELLRHELERRDAEVAALRAQITDIGKRKGKE